MTETDSGAALFVPIAALREGYERFLATRYTVSVWAETMQHGAPPSALLTRALENCAPRPEARLARVTMEILGPVPVAEIEVRAWIERPGRRVEMLAAELVAQRPDGTARTVARATAWRIATSDTSAVAFAAEAPLVPGPEDSEPGWGFAADWHGGYLDALEFRGVVPVDPQEGTGSLWTRSLVPVVAGETPSPITRLFGVADIANGVGARLDAKDWTFLNTDLTVEILREPVGEWVGVRARTSIAADGIGLCAATLYDADGAVGRSFQTLEVRAR